EAPRNSPARPRISSQDSSPQARRNAMTAQAGDRLIFEGHKHTLYTIPLASYSSKEHPLPKFVPRSSPNWRGYCAPGAVEDDELRRTAIGGTVEGDRRVGWAEVFPRLKPPLRADWFSGDLRVPQGEQIHYVHMGFASIYAQDLILTVYRGDVVVSE